MRPNPTPRRSLGSLEALDPEPPPLDRPATVQVLPAAEPSGQAAIDGAIDGDEPHDLPADPPASIPASPHPRGKAQKGSRSGSRIRPYKMADGSGHTIKQSFTGDLAFDDLWRAVPGLLPRGIERSEWAVKVLTRAIHALERAKAEAPKAK